MATIESAWLSGRELLVRELGERVRVLRTRLEGGTGATPMPAGLVVFLERRLAHMQEGLAMVGRSSGMITQSVRHGLDRMLAALVGTLRHAEAALDEGRVT
jgi:hypothetical protein